MQTRVSWNPYMGTRTRTRVYVNVALICEHMSIIRSSKMHHY